MGKRTWGRPALVVAVGVLGVLGGAGCRENGSASPPAETRAGGGAVATGGTVGASASAAASEPVAARARVVLLGTSLTAGLGLDPAEAYPALLQQRADSAGYRVEVVNAGLSGETSAGALRRARWVLEQPAALVVLEVGANDGLRGVDPDSTYANLVALVGVVRAAQPGARVVLMQMEAPTNLGARYTAGFHAAYPRASRATGVPLWPFLLEGVAGDPRYNQADGIHPNVAGSERVAATVWRSLGPVLADLFGGAGTR